LSQLGVKTDVISIRENTHFFPAVVVDSKIFIDFLSGSLKQMILWAQKTTKNKFPLHFFLFKIFF